MRAAEGMSVFVVLPAHCWSLRVGGVAAAEAPVQPLCHIAGLHLSLLRDVNICLQFPSGFVCSAAEL